MERKKIYFYYLKYRDKVFKTFLRKELCMASKQDRFSITLKCTVCGEENYITSKNKKKNPDRLEKEKYCPRCQKKTLHREKKK